MYPVDKVDKVMKMSSEQKSGREGEREREGNRGLRVFSWESLISRGR